MKTLFKQHPFVSAVLIFIGEVLLAALSQVAAQKLLPNFNPAFIGVIVLTLATIALVGALRWWREVGITWQSEWRNLNLLWLPAAVILLPPLVGGFKALSWEMVAFLTVAYILTGLNEELLWRGVVVNVLRPTGPWRAMFISALLFGLAHLPNILVRGNPAIIFAQALGAFCDGAGFAALRLRTNTIWPLIGLHFLHDLLLNTMRLPLIPVDVVQVTILLIYGIYIMRHYQPETVTPNPQPAANVA